MSRSAAQIQGKIFLLTMLIYIFNIRKLLPEFIIVALLLTIDLGQIIISVTLP